MDGLIAEVWAMEPMRLEQLATQLARARGQVPGEEAAQVEPVAPGPGYELTGGSAVIPITGVILKEADWIYDYLGIDYTTTNDVEDALAGALQDGAAIDIVLYVDSPGGIIDGVQELADAVYEAKSIKPVRAYVSDTAASAAYWIASQAGAVAANRTARVGAIGVYTVLYDSSAAYDEAGFKVHLIASGENKGVGEPGVPISDEQLQPYREIINGQADEFNAAVARGRGMGLAEVSALATGRMWVADEAVSLGLVDGLSIMLVTGADGRPMPYKGVYRETRSDSAAGARWAAVPFPHGESAALCDDEWSAVAELRGAGAEDLRRMSALEDVVGDGGPGSFKLLHHKQDGNAVVRQAALSARDTIKRGGIKGASRAELKKADAHLARHERAFSSHDGGTDRRSDTRGGRMDIELTAEERKEILIGATKGEVEDIRHEDVAAWKKDGKIEERERLDAFVDAFDADPAYALEAYRGGKPLDECKLAYAEQRAERAETALEEAKTLLASKGQEGVTFTASDSEEAEAEAKAKAEAEGDGAKDAVQRFDARVAELTADGKMTRGQAIVKIAEEDSDLHEAYVRAVNA